jgi:tetratricopeptide (TPR) repeat protein
VYALGFRHLLIRDAAYGSIPKATRADLHERFAEWLDRTSGSLGERDEIVGYHLEQAYRFRVEIGPDDERVRAIGDGAAERLAAAGRRAFAHSDVSATVNLLGRATDLLAPDDPRQPELLADLGLALTRSDLPRADEVLAAAVRAAHAAGDPRLEARASARRVWVRLVLDPEADQQRSLDEVQRYVGLFDGWSDDLGLAESLMLVGSIHFWAGRMTLAERELERARTHAHRAGSPTQGSDIERMLILVISQGPTPVPVAIERLRAVLEMSTGDRKLEAGTATKLAELEAMLGRFEPARELVVRAKMLNEELGDQVAVARSLSDAARIEMLAGAPSAAEAEARAAFDVLRGMGNIGQLASAAPHLGDIVYELGRHDEAMELAELTERISIEGDVDAGVRWRLVQAKVLARRGRSEDAARLAADAVRIAAPTEYLDLRADALFAQAEVDRLAGRSSDAVGSLREALELCRQKGNLVRAAQAERQLAELGERTT